MNRSGPVPDQAFERAETRREVTQNDASGGQLMVILGLVAVLFFFGLAVLDRAEILVDVDFKPFFIPLLFTALLPLGRNGKIAWTVGLGAAVGEALGDLLEGYGIEDPFGFVGYVIGFAIAGYIIANRPLSIWRLIVAPPVAAVIHAASEAAAFYLFGVLGSGDANLRAVLISFVGNSVAHGIVMGSLLLPVVVYLLHGRIERSLGFAPLPR